MHDVQCITHLKIWLQVHADGRLQRDKLLICPSDPHNITLIFIPITKFIEEIEMATNCKIG